MGNFYVLVGEWKFKRQIAPQCYYENSVHLTVPLTGSLGPRSSPDWTVRTTVLKVKTVYCSQKLPIDSMHACSVASVLSNSLRPRGLYPPGSSVHGILQARVLEWVAMPSSRGSSQLRDWTLVSYVSCIGRRFFTTCATWDAPVVSLRSHKICVVFLIIIFFFSVPGVAEVLCSLQVSQAPFPLSTSRPQALTAVAHGFSRPALSWTVTPGSPTGQNLPPHL